MAPTRKHPRKKTAPRPAPQPVAAPETDDDDDEAPPDIFERPDGFYWQAPDGHQEFGPFESHELAQADRDAVGDEALPHGLALQQIERETGVADGIDARTGEPSDDESPHLQEE